MSSPPVDRSEFWIRFVCGFLFFGIFNSLIGLRFFAYSTGLVPTMVGAVVITLAMSLFVARIGDEGWYTLINWLFWWRH